MSGPRFLGMDVRDPDVIPYFTWDAPLTVREIRERLAFGPESERFRLLGRILREARDPDVWAFTTPEFVARNLEKLRPYLGRRRPFWEWLLQRWEEAVVVDLVRDPTPRGWPPQAFGQVQVDRPQEILANKLCALLSRSELRDLVDVYVLEQVGFRVEQALAVAQRKDAGLTPAQLAWVLSQVDLSALPEGRIALQGTESTDERLPSRRELVSFLEDLSRRLAAIARPGM